MSAMTASSPATHRPTTITAAIVLLVLLGLSVLIPFSGTDQIPQAALILGYVFAVLKLVAAAGLWRCRKWAAILGFVAVLLDALASAPGIIGAPSAALQVYVIIAFIASIAALILLALPTSRRAYV